MTFEFSDDKQGRARLFTAHRAFVTWSRVPENQQKRKKTMREDEAQILTQLEGISDPVGLEPEDGPDMRLRRLQKGGGSIQLNYDQLEMLIDRVDEAPMFVEEASTVQELITFLRTEKLRDKKPEDAPASVSEIRRKQRA